MNEKKPASAKIKEALAAFPKKLQYNSPLILSFALVSFGVLMLCMATGQQSTRLLFSVYRTSFADPLFYVRLFGHSLGHADLSHYLNNFLIILLVGPVLEEKYGAKKLLLMICITTLIIGALHSAIFTQTALLGASGVTFMFIILNPYVNLKEGKIPLTLILCIVLFLGREVTEQLANPGSNISHFSHIIGGVCGIFFGYFINFGAKKTEGGK
jgi:membrane associated rhomboid family serine protease